ncbi:MAG: PilC/PilY family type IV pilus protein, partial [Desulfobacteria bacterium]
MRRLRHYWFISIFLTAYLIFLCNPGLADDTCVFAVSADDVPPNIVLLLDNGAEMEQIVWHASYDNSTDYTPNPATPTDVVPNGALGNGFFDDNGYGIVKQGSDYYLVPVLSTLELGSYSDGLLLGSSGTYGTVTLPVVPSSSVDADGIKDNAAHFRYSKNYLNWIFFSGNYAGDGSDLPAKSRFYYAKKAILTVAKLTANQASFGLYNFTSNHSGASSVQPLGMVVNTPLAALPENNTLESNFVNNVNNMGTVTYSPLAEGLASVGGYYASPSSHVVGEYCQKSFALVVSPGVSSYDNFPPAQTSPSSFSDYDGDNNAGGIGEGNIKADASIYTIPTNLNGSTYLDDVAHYLYTNDIVGYEDGFQNISTYTIGFMGDQESNLFLTNTSNNGNGNVNLYDTTDPEYGKYHFTADSPDTLSSVLLEAISQIVSETNTFTAPVVPVTRTTSGNRIYMAFFTPGDENFWEGNVTKFGLSDDNLIMDASDPPQRATWDNGAIKEGAVPYWQTKDWADSILHSDRNIYTYLGGSLVDFNSGNVTAADLGNPTHTTEEIIDYIRGRDVLDEDDNGQTNENRAVITGDVLHSEPLVVYYTSTTAVVYFGSNDGMLHAVYDEEGHVDNGKELWAFIPPDQLPRLKLILEGTGHQYFVDSSPKAFINDVDEDGVIEAGEQVILICGVRGGGSSYFALDITDYNNPQLLWTIDPSQADFAELGETWSEPQFGVVETTADSDGVDVFFIGGGYSSDNTAGKAVFAV